MIFLHGYLSDKRSFAYQYQFFSRYFTVYAFDFQGFGENKGMEYPYSLSDYVNQLKAFIEKHELYKPHVIAHSFGGRVALKTAYSSPDLLGKLVLTGSAGLKPKWNFIKALKKTTFKILKPFLSEKGRLKFYSSDYLALDLVMRQSFIKIVNESLDYTLNSINNQTFIIFGKNDKETPIYMAKRLNKGLKNSKIFIIDGAGHFCFVDKPLIFNTEVREFLLS